MSRAKNKSSSSQQLQITPRRRRRRKVLQFSPSSNLLIYPNDITYDTTKSYTSRDRKKFGRAILKDAKRLNRYLDDFNISEESISSSSSSSSVDQSSSSCSNTMSDDSDGCSNILPTEEILGIEHYLFGSNQHDYIQRRKVHAKRMLKTYRFQQRTNHLRGESSSEMQLRLAQLSMMLTESHRVQARERAWRAIPSERCSERSVSRKVSDMSSTSDGSISLSSSSSDDDCKMDVGSNIL